MNNPIKNAMDTKLASLAWDERHSRRLLRAVQEGTKMKKKLPLSLAIALGMVLIAAAAYAALTFTRAPQADAAYKARQALVETYGLSPATLGLFNPVEEKTDSGWVVTFYGEGLANGLIGDYTVRLQGEEAAASWTHDSADKALLDSGSLASPAWGQQQMKRALLEPEAANQAIARYYEEHPEERGKPPAFQPPQITLKEGESYWNGLMIQAGQPDKKALPLQEAQAKAEAAIKEEFALTKEDLQDALIEHSYHVVVSKAHSPLRGFRFFFEKDGVNLDIGVMMDAYTGEIYTIGIMTGGNE